MLKLSKLFGITGIGLAILSLNIIIIIGVLSFSIKPAAPIEERLEGENASQSVAIAPTAVPTRVVEQAAIQSTTAPVVEVEAVAAALPTSVPLVQDIGSPGINSFVMPPPPVQQAFVVPITSPNTLEQVTEEIPFSEPVNIDFVRITSIPPELQMPIQEAMISNKSILPSVEAWTVSAFRSSSTGEWARVVLVPTYIVDSGWTVSFDINEIVEALARRDTTGNWKVYLYQEDEFSVIAKDVPSSFVNLTALYSVTADEEYRFPWTKGQNWWKNGGWHNGDWGLVNFAIDFQPKSEVWLSDPNIHLAVLAANAGVLDVVCDPNTGQPDTENQIWLKITHADGTSGYGHLDGQSVALASGHLLGQHVERGQYLGNLYNPNPGDVFNSRCGRGASPHLHFIFPHPAISMFDELTGQPIPAQVIGINNGIPGASYTSNNIRIGGDINTAPTLADDFPTTVENQSVTFDVLANDTDPDGDALVITEFTLPTNGALVQNADTTFSYTPNWGFSGQDTFTYTVADPDGLTAVANVTITVQALHLSVPGDYAYCEADPASDTITISGIGNRTLNGSFIVEYITGPSSRQHVATYPVQHTGPDDFSITIDYPPLSEWTVFIDPRTGKPVAEIHVDIRIPVSDANGELIREPGGDVWTLGPGKDWDLWCLDVELEQAPPTEPVVEPEPPVEEIIEEPQPPVEEIIEEPQPPVEEIIEEPQPPVEEIIEEPVDEVIEEPVDEETGDEDEELPAETDAGQDS